MNLAVFAFTRRGCETARQAASAIPADHCRMFTMAKFSQPDFESYHPPLQDFTAPLFSWADLILFIGSTGMAVRAISPWVRDKKTDPGVIVIDESGNYVISLLSGHIGGANGYARRIATFLNAVPVITTATDVNGKFAMDDWAARNGLAISSMEYAKAVSAAILEENIPLCSDFPIAGQLPQGLVSADSGALGIALTYRTTEPFSKTLRLIPQVVTLGIGCRRGTTMDAIEQAVLQVMTQNSIDPRAICGVYSIDLKKDETGLLEFCEKWKKPVHFYTAEQLRRVPGSFPASGFVSQVTGVDNVCQRAAMAEADICIVKKTALDGVTVSMGLQTWEAVF